ncbi:unnamed protein product [Ciceribacter sp. T2.26MG-112.2]|nr:unnamed protein product [Ciceribacter naphthalenivorans]
MLKIRDRASSSDTRLIPPPVLAGSGSAGWHQSLSASGPFADRRHPVRAGRDITRRRSPCKPRTWRGRRSRPRDCHRAANALPIHSCQTESPENAGF